LPIAAVAVEPQRRLKDRTSIEPAATDAAAALLGHETGAHQHLDVARNRLQRNLEWRRQLGDQQVFTIKLVEYLAANRVRECAEHRIEGFEICSAIGHG